ncbi:MAG: FtsX-like permease family protein [Campylobacterota bacterium]|nr:FtsX-like permease family protein [Campylobacterota bacterium]
MNPIYKIALMNIFYNKKRSIVTILLGVISTALLIFSTSITEGSHQKMLQNAVEVYPGYVQITHNKFRDNPSFEHLIFDSEAVFKQLDKDEQIKSYTSRFQTAVLFASKEKSTGVILTGIEPSKEKIFSKIYSSLIKGKYINESDKNEVYLGSDLAARLKVDIGDELSFVGTAADYSFCADNLTVKGIFKTGLYEFDASSAFLNKKYFDEVFVSDNISTTIVVMPKDPRNSLKISENINRTIPDDIISKSWEQFMESLLKAMELDSVFGYLTLSIFFLVIAFVILIYTLLVVYSRIKIIGVLKALGTSKQQIREMLLLESVALGIISAFIGALIGGYISFYFSINPIDYGKEFEEQFKQYGMMVTTIPSVFDLGMILRDTVIIFILNMAATVYPIIKVNKYIPIEAINHV